MALIKCPECYTEVSTSAYNCPKCGGQLRKPKRGFFGTLFKWGFILFNLLMVLWLISYWGDIGEMSSTARSDAELTGTAIGGAIGTSMLLGVWVFGDIILGLFVLFTRPRT
ncbi:hypothetical protein HX771_16265 [Vibrio parahaemolyticus]|nr:hypothetical protein [Vibrio parahaemolyticus]